MVWVCNAQPCDFQLLFWGLKRAICAQLQGMCASRVSVIPFRNREICPEGRRMIHFLTSGLLDH